MTTLRTCAAFLRPAPLLLRRGGGGSVIAQQQQQQQQRAVWPTVMSAAPAAPVSSETAASSGGGPSSSGSSDGSGRPSSAGLSLELRVVAENPDLVKAHLRDRCASEDVVASVDALVKLSGERSVLIQAGDDARGSRKQLSADIGKLMKGGAGAEDEEVLAKKAEVETAAGAADAADEKLADVDAAIADAFDALPNLLDDAVPPGKGEDDNELVFEWGTDQRKVAAAEEAEAFAWHDDIAASFGGYKTEEAARLSGARFSVLGGEIARLERALVQFFLDRHSEENGYTEMAVPYIVGRSVLEGTGQLPKFEEDLFKVNHQVNGEDGFLIPTAEVPLTNLFRESILDHQQLPLSVTALTPCFRAEAGSYGKDVRGLMRQHQFHKVEMVKVTTPEESAAAHEEMTGHAEELLQLLGLPYRKMKLCSGDIGFGAKMCYDLEVSEWVGGWVGEWVSGWVAYH